MGSLPPLASVVAAHMGPTASARLSMCATSWQFLMPTCLPTVNKREWVERWWQRPPQDSALNDRWPRGGRALYAVVDEAWLSITQEPSLLERCDARGMSPLHSAARARCAPLCRMLICVRANVNEANANDGWTPLHCAAAAGDAACVTALLEARADSTKQDDLYQIPMALAVRTRCEAVQSVLLEHMEGKAVMSGPTGDQDCAIL